MSSGRGIPASSTGTLHVGKGPCLGREGFERHGIRDLDGWPVHPRIGAHDLVGADLAAPGDDHRVAAAAELLGRGAAMPEVPPAIEMVLPVRRTRDNP